MNQKILKIGKNFYHKFPVFQPILGFIDRKFIFKTKFSGWGMKTEHEVPWNNPRDSEVFIKASKDIKKFKFVRNSIYYNEKNIDELLWRHWIVSYAVRHAIEFTSVEKFNFVECGVAEGCSAFFALRQIKNNKKVNGEFSMHLYDSWDAMKKDLLVKSEFENIGRYESLDIDITKSNLSEFNNNVVYHKGYIPESLYKTPISPDFIVYLHIDLNSSIATKEALEFFFPKIIKGGLILFDDYGWAGYEDSEKIIDEFFSKKKGLLMNLPTGQAIFFVN
jgi:hypothetical protein